MTYCLDYPRLLQIPQGIKDTNVHVRRWSLRSFQCRPRCISHSQPTCLPSFKPVRVHTVCLDGLLSILLLARHKEGRIPLTEALEQHAMGPVVVVVVVTVFTWLWLLFELPSSLGILLFVVFCHVGALRFHEIILFVELL